MDIRKRIMETRRALLNKAAGSDGLFRHAIGCCICGSRIDNRPFSSSGPYESIFPKCFLVKKRERSGDICYQCRTVAARFMNGDLKDTFEHVSNQVFYQSVY